MHWSAKIALSLGILSISVTLLTVVSSSINDAESKAFERGAHAVIVHHQYFQNYGSAAYRAAVFESGEDPQDSVDVAKFQNQKAP